MNAHEIDTEEARRRDFIFCSEYGCVNVVPDAATADRQGWSSDQYYYEGRHRRCPGPHNYAWELSPLDGSEESAMKFGEYFLSIVNGIAGAFNRVADQIRSKGTDRPPGREVTKGTIRAGGRTPTTPPPQTPDSVRFWPPLTDYRCSVCGKQLRVGDDVFISVRHVEHQSDEEMETERLLKQKRTSSQHRSAG